MSSNYNKKTFEPCSRKPLDSSSCSNSFQMSLNGLLMTSINLNHSTKTHHPTPSRKHHTKSSTRKSTTTKKTKSSTSKIPFGGDRFMAEKPKNFDMAHYLLQQPEPGTEGSSSSKPSDANTSNNKSINNYSMRHNENSYSRSLTENVLGISELSGTRVLSFMKKPKFALEGYENALKVLYLGTSAPQPHTLTNYRRVIPKSAERVLDAPGIVDDFYLNVLDWSKKNVVGIGLKDQVY